jgi:phosphoglycolate phosphatase
MMTPHQFDLLVFDWEGTLANPWASPLKTLLFPGAYQMLQALKQAGFLLAIATGKSRSGLTQAMQEVNVASFFSMTCTAEESAPKPSPEMLSGLITALEVDSARTLMIGDTSYDLEMANALQVPAVAVTYGLHKTDILEKYHPRYCADSVSSLHQWLLFYA